MWLADVQLNTKMFAIVASMLGFMRLSVVQFFSNAIHYLSHYLSARQRIQVNIEQAQIEKQSNDIETLDISFAERIQTRHTIVDKIE
jgi:hypothetical protein